MAEVDMQCRWDHVDPVLWSGDGAALFVLEHRRLNPPAGPVETVQEYWRRIDAVQAYQKSISTWREDATGFLRANRDAARVFRRENPGCSFADVMQHIADLNRAEGGE